MAKISDADSRQKIIHDILQNYFVNASAGSGKTYSLASRMVSLVEKGVDISKVCTITFTVAAANEFYSRFQDMLSERSNEESEEQKKIKKEKYDLGFTTAETRQRCRNALEKIDTCFMGTIDSFCNMIAHEYPNELEIPTGASVISEDLLIESIKKEFDLLSKDSSHDLHNYITKYFKIFSSPYERFVQGIKTVMEFRQYNFVYDHFDFDADLNLLLEGLKECYEGYAQSLESSEIQYNPKSSASMERGERVKYIFDNDKVVTEDDYNEKINDLEKFLKYIRATKFVKKEIADTQLLADGYYNEDGKPSEAFVEELDKYLGIIGEYKYSLFMDVIVKSLEDITKKLKANGYFTFFDFILYLRNALQKSSSGDHKLIDHIFSRHSYFLIDESQDTNPLQTELFFFLAGTKITDKWYETEPKEGSLFIVGDPKQSIYRFRGADVSSYLFTESIFEKKDEVLVMSRNFRSNREMREFFNNTMNPVLNNEIEPLIHEDIEILTNEEYVTEPCALKGAYKYNVTGSDPIKADAEFVSKLITNLVNNPNYLIKGKKDKNFRKIEYKDFMLVPKTTTISDYIKECRDKNIPLTIEGKLPFDECYGLVTLKDLFFLMIDPTNKKYLANVLTGKLFNLSNNDICNIFNSEIPYKVYEECTKPRLYKEIFDQLYSWYSGCKHLSFSAQLSYLFEQVEIFKIIELNYFEFIYYLIELVKEAEINLTVLTKNDAITFIETIFTGEDKKDRVLRFLPNVNRVKISNVHKVKGLQAPIVILIEPKCKRHEPKNYVDTKNGNSDVYIFSFKPIFNGDIPIQTHKHDDKLEIARKCDDAEKRRLEYVAATRAESLLIVSDYFVEKTKSNELSPWNHIADEIKEELNFGIEENKDEYIPNTIKTDELYKGKLSLDTNNQQSYSVLKPSEDKVVVRRNTNNTDIDDDKIDLLNVGDLSQFRRDIVGTIVHRMMELLVISKNSISKDNLLDLIINEIGLPQEYRDLLEKYYNKVISGGFKQVNGSLPANFLPVLLNAKEVMCEIPFSYKLNDKDIVSGIIDVIYKDDNGYHIVDYKTDDEFDVSILLTKHGDQLNLYKRIVKEELGIDADTNIYHLG